MGEPLNYIRWFSEISNDDVPLVGGKNASLGEMLLHALLDATDTDDAQSFSRQARRARELVAGQHESFLNISGDPAASGVMFTLDPDEFFVHKPTFEQGYRSVLRRRQTSLANADAVEQGRACKNEVTTAVLRGACAR